MVIAGSNTYMKIGDIYKFSVTSWYIGFLGRYSAHSLFDKFIKKHHKCIKEMTDKKHAQNEKTEHMYKLNGKT